MAVKNWCAKCERKAFSGAVYCGRCGGKLARVAGEPSAVAATVESEKGRGGHEKGNVGGNWDDCL